MPEPRLSSTLDLGQSTYDFKYRIFPEDLGQEDMAHYMVININVPVRRSVSGTFTGGLSINGPSNPSIFTRKESILWDDYSKVDTLRFRDNNTITAGLNPLQNGSNRELGINALTLSRGTRRIKESIALHMPNGGLVFTEENKYEEISMTALAGGLIATGLKGAISALAPNETTRNLALSVVDATGNAIKRGGQLVGYPINPSVEVLFASRPQRQWVFEVFMLPRSEEEVETVKEIIRTFRFYAAPEITGFGYFFLPPAEFDITFFHAGKENLNLPRVNTCVLQRIDIDYAPEQSYSTFMNGHPIATRMSLSFTEVEVLHKARINQGF